MAKRISAKVGEYPDPQDQSKTKGEYVQIGVILNNDNGEYVLLDPSVSLSGVLAKQNEMEWKKGGQMRGNIVCGIYEDQPKNQ